MQRFKDRLSLSRETNTIFSHLKVSLEAFFPPKLFEQIKKVFIFRQGNCTINVLHPSLLKSFALSICSRDSMKNSTVGYFCKSTYSQMHRKLHLKISWVLEDNYCVPFFKMKFLIPHYVTYFVCQRLQKFTEKVTPKVPFREISCENIHFCGFKKRDFCL